MVSKHGIDPYQLMWDVANEHTTTAFECGICGIHLECMDCHMEVAPERHVVEMIIEKFKAHDVDFLVEAPPDDTDW